MNTIGIILKKLKECKYKVSTDTRKDISGSFYFAIRGETFDGNEFVGEALKNGAVGAVTDNPKNAGQNIYVVDDVLKTLQVVASEYIKQFTIPIIVIGGSNGKTTSKDLTRDILKTKYKVHATESSLNNHIGVPLSVLSMDGKTEIGVFEIGANHHGEHTGLLNIIKPTHVIVTNNGMDHLEGFGSPEGIRSANKEMYDWALEHQATVFVNKKFKDLLEDSKNNIRILYQQQKLKVNKSAFVTILWDKKEYKTNLIGSYNVENIELALSVGKYFDVDIKIALDAVCKYIPSSKRSQFITKDGVNFIVDCYNANPTSMKLSIDSFMKLKINSNGVILGDMLELGEYSDDEHKKIVQHIATQKLGLVVFVGKNFKKALEDVRMKHYWFPDSDSARMWFIKQKFDSFTFFLKGSRGMKIEKILD